MQAMKNKSEAEIPTQNNRAVKQAKPKVQTIRRLKVRPMYVTLPRSLKYDDREKEVPLIMLTGEWLRKAGFNCESYVVITQQPGELRIRLETL